MIKDIRIPSTNVLIPGNTRAIFRTAQGSNLPLATCDTTRANMLHVLQVLEPIYRPFATLSTLLATAHFSSHLESAPFLDSRKRDFLGSPFLNEMSVILTSQLVSPIVSSTQLRVT